MDEKTLKSAYRNAWLLTAVAAVFIAVFFVFTVKMNLPPHPVEWNMGATPFIPASGPAATGYYVAPAKEAEAPKAAKEAK